MGLDYWQTSIKPKQEAQAKREAQKQKRTKTGALLLAFFFGFIACYLLQMILAWILAIRLGLI